MRAETRELVDLSGGCLEAPTRVALAWNDEALALGARVIASPPLRLGVTTPNGPVYEDECVELFLSRPGEPARYLEVVANALGVVYAARILNPEASRASWEVERGVDVPGLRVSVRGDAREPSGFGTWEVTIEVPWEAAGGIPSAGEARAGNVMRIARGATTRFEALSPTFRSDPPDFHVPTCFARIVF